MKKLIIALVLLSGCQRETNWEKPFVIVYKEYSGADIIHYKYTDKGKVLRDFYDTKNYSIGDTIH